MNLFVVDYNPVKAAQELCDKHCIKMCLETAQLLCTVFNLQGFQAPYKTTHKNHPVSIWVRESRKNFEWALQHGLAICSEYKGRYRKTHKSEAVIRWCGDNIDSLTFENYELTPFALAMPDDCKCSDAVLSYRTYYLKYKSHIFSWRRNKPIWVGE